MTRINWETAASQLGVHLKYSYIFYSVNFGVFPGLLTSNSGWCIVFWGRLDSSWLEGPQGSSLLFSFIIYYFFFLKFTLWFYWNRVSPCSPADSTMTGLSGGLWSQAGTVTLGSLVHHWECSVGTLKQNLLWGLHSSRSPAASPALPPAHFPRFPSQLFPSWETAHSAPQEEVLVVCFLP